MEEKNTENKKSESALREEKILAFWKENDIFQKSITQREGGKEFVFYDGPVTANSKPVLHTLVPFSFKDLIPRYKTMQGYHARRKGGWDTHGLPVELQIEKKLGFNSKNDIEKYGIAAFNKLCRDSVWEYIGLWKNLTQRAGYWADQENAYVTYHNDYIESVWNILQKIDERGLLYKDYKVLPWCPRCGTALSSHELAQGYQDDKDLSVYVKFKLKSGQKIGDYHVDNKTYILAWTTTPWTLPGNAALAIREDLQYDIVESNGDNLIFSAHPSSYERIFGKNINQDSGLPVNNYKQRFLGKDLIGLEYEPLYPYLANKLPASEKSKLDKAYKVYSADFVNTEEGTGVVHTAVMYGQDDFVLGNKIGLPKFHLVNPEGHFIDGMDFLSGRFVKDEETAVEIIKDLAHQELLFKKEKYEHSYPHCWRCKTALIYYARDSWYIRMSDPTIKQGMIDENQKINWEPAYIRDGRFGEWLREIKDWAVSRERYWGTPLPVWDCVKCNKRQVIGRIKELKEKTKKSGNTYFVMRHGEAENNLKNIYSSDPGIYSLTRAGEKVTKERAKQLKSKKITYIYCSPFLRTKQTAEMVADEIGFPKNKIIYDSRIRELGFGDFSERPTSELDQYAKGRDWNFDTRIPGGETLQEVKKRFGDFLYEVDNDLQNENVLIVTHGIATETLPAVVVAADKKDSMKINRENFKKSPPGSFMEINDFVKLPHNENYELDLHRPYIDEIKLACTCGEDLVRTREVMDVWFDSGAMPFAQDHYPFENKDWIDKKGGFPADYISEAIDQTRGWFYTLHAIGTLMERGKAYKNVICLGHLLDAKGKKMSKSLGNVVDPFEAINKYGVDTLRLWMYSVNQPGESKNFDEKTVSLLHGQVFTLLYNVLVFYDLYRDKNLETNDIPESKNVLDIWILAKLNELIHTATNHLDNYKLLEPVRAIRDFIDDLSTWYLRRSRERIKEGDKDAKQTLYFVLKNLAKVMAPFAPFTAEDIWLKLRNEKDGESVHLTEWPKVQDFDSGTKLLEEMKVVREIVSLGLKLRQVEGVPVRQPLQTISYFMNTPVGDKYAEMIQEELNVKNIKFEKKDDALGTIVQFDFNVTPELKTEGNYRELVRALQDMRKKMGLTPSDVIMLSFKTDANGKKLLQKFENDLKKTVLVSSLEIKEDDGKKSVTCTRQEIKIDGLVFRVKIVK